MSMAIGHFAVGVSFASVALLATGLYRHREAPFSVFLGGFWAMVPDLWRFAEAIPQSFHESIWANLFVGHRLLDVRDTTDSETLAAAMLAVMCASLATLLWFRIRAARAPEDDVTAYTTASRSD